MVSILAQISILFVGLLTGGLLLIGGGLLPYWLSLEPMEFSHWFGANSRFLTALMMPVGRAAVFLSVLTMILARIISHPGTRLLAVSAFFVLVIAALQVFYFDHANDLLGSGSLSASDVSAELASWRRWHWVRFSAGLIAVATALRGLIRNKR